MATNAPPSQDPLDIPSQVEHQYKESTNTPSTQTTSTSAPSSTSNASSQAATIKDNVVNTASSTMSSIANHPTTQQVKDTVVNGPVGQTVQKESAKTSAEFQDLANARTTPAEPAATGQPLTHYHSLFYRLLSWKSPRATGIVFASIVAVIFASRYISFARYFFKATYTVLGLTAAAEASGKLVFGNGFATQLRPRKYYTIRKESLERFLDDVEQLINFVVIEAQRILFVENIWVTALAFGASFLSYFLIKLLPFWGLTLLGTSVTFLAPLVYINNKEFIDEHLNHAGNVISSQASQVRDMAAQNANQASQSFRSYAGEYSQKAQELIDNARGKAASTTNGASTTKTSDFPTAPKTEPAASKSTTSTGAEPQLVS